MRHGFSGTPTYECWVGMRRRCSSPRHHKFKYYGGRGIRVCERWQRFENFLADMGPRPSRAHTVDRIDTNGHYEPCNCRWATPVEQQNNRRNNKLIEFRGQRMTVRQALNACSSSVNLEAAHTRIAIGWPVEIALTLPLTRTR